LSADYNRFRGNRIAADRALGKSALMKPLRYKAVEQKTLSSP
jgi:hypothetical protein